MERESPDMFTKSSWNQNVPYIPPCISPVTARPQFGFYEVHIIKSDNYEKFINATYEDDYDIVSLDTIVTNFIKEESSKKLKEIEDVLNFIKGYKVDESKELKLTKDKSFYESMLDNYLKERGKVLENYLALNGKISPRYFGEVLIESSTKTKEQKLLLVAEYLEVAKRYMPVNIVRIKKTGSHCQNCGKKMKTMDEYCHSCRYMSDETIVVQKISGKIGNYQSDPEKRENFEKKLNKFQGKFPFIIPSEVFSAIDKYFVIYADGQLSKSNMVTIPNDEYGGKPGTSKPLMLSVMSNLGLTQYNDNVEVICREYWGWICPDYTMIKDDVMKYYDTITNSLRKISKAKRPYVSSPYLLFWILRQMLVKCRKEDFRIPTTTDIIERYSVVRRDVCLDLGWEVISLE